MRSALPVTHSGCWLDLKEPCHSGNKWQLLSVFTRCLSEPLMTFKLHKDFIMAVSKSKEVTPFLSWSDYFTYCLSYMQDWILSCWRKVGGKTGGPNYLPVEVKKGCQKPDDFWPLPLVMYSIFLNVKWWVIPFIHNFKVGGYYSFHLKC